MANVKEAFGGSGTLITVTLASLAASATVGRSSLVVDNTTNLYVDALVSITSKLAAGTPANDKGIYVYAYGSSDAGASPGTTGAPHYTDGVAGTDASFTRTDPPNLALLGFLNMPAGATQYTGGPWPVAATCFGGILPEKWGLVIINNSGLALDSTAGSHQVWFEGVYATVI